jgi:hypothetical protein
MVECSKRQKETVNGVQQLRCMNSMAQQHGQLVVLSTCEGCPVRVARSLPVVQSEQLPQCEWRFNNVRCTVTGLNVDANICNRCSKETARQEATMPDMARNMYGAVRRWVASMMPVRSQEEVEAILNEHCLQCEVYDPEKKACKNCGCRVSDSSVPLLNKIKMKTEVCPLGRWK